ncbi:class I SAM-dependent methyltransferase [soil metagenome]
MRKVLNVGGNSKSIPIPKYYADFEHLILDIDPRGEPDILCDARALATRPPAEFDAIYCSHNLEHFYRHDVPRVLGGFHHVLTAEGFAEIRVPDLELVMKTAVEKKLDLEDVLYTSGAGAITVRDVFYGFGLEIERSGQDFYAHKTGFTRKSLGQALLQSGFRYVLFRPGRAYEILAYGFKNNPTPEHEALLDFSTDKVPRAVPAAS